MEHIRHSGAENRDEYRTPGKGKLNMYKLAMCGLLSKRERLVRNM
jgi:hypothetical protein